MKIRQGFVSNSSSSSFVIAVGKVINTKKFLEEAKKYGLSEWDYELVIFKDKDIVAESFNWSEVSIGSNKLEPGDTVVKIESFGNEGDQSFMEDGDWGDINYDIGWSDIDSPVTKFLDECTSLDHIEISHGAGRNG